MFLRFNSWYFLIFIAFINKHKLINGIWINNKNIIKHSTWKKLSGTGKPSTKRKTITKMATRKLKTNYLSLSKAKRPAIRIFINLSRLSPLAKFLNKKLIRQTLKPSVKLMLEISYNLTRMICHKKDFWKITR